MYNLITSRSWRSIGVFSALVLTLLSLMPKSAQAATVYTFTAGVMDGYSTSNGLEPSSPSRGAVTWLNNLLSANCTNTPSRCQIRNFDENGYDKDFLHTFTLPAELKGKITGASLEIRVRALGGGSINDQISLGFIHPFSGQRDTINGWNRLFGNSGGVPGLLNTFWNSGVDHIFNFDLANLIPHPAHTGRSRDLIPALNTRGFLDIHVQDDTIVDYMKLTVTVVPEPLTIIGSATALGFGVFFKRQQGKNQKKNNTKTIA